MINSKDSISYIVELDSISKKYKKPFYGFNTLLWFAFKNFRYICGGKKALVSTDSKCVLDNITLKIKERSSLGIVGLNGSGKSTLLQIIVGVLKPTSGKVKVKGKIASLLELGSGFDPQFTGRENVILNAKILGLSEKEIDERIGSILEFSGIGDYIDNPVKTYSSGMSLRLAFSVIVHVDADLLVIDEALSVGDAVFMQKCMRFIREFKKRGTLIFVSHDLASIQSICEDCIWLSGGKIISSGDTKTVSKQYLQDIISKRNQTHRSFEGLKNNIFKSRNFDISSNWCRLNEISLIDKGNGCRINSIKGMEVVELMISFEVSRAIKKPVVGFILKNSFGQDILGDNTFDISSQVESQSSSSLILVKFCFEVPLLLKGEYSFSVALAEIKNDGNIIHHVWIHEALVLSSDYESGFTGLVGIPMLNKSISFS